MLAIYPRRETLATVYSLGTTGTSNTSYPASNLLDDHSRRPCISLASTMVIRLELGANSELVAGFGIFAESVYCSITEDGEEKALDNSAATDEGGGVVGIPVPAHGCTHDDVVVFYGPSNYFGPYTLQEGMSLGTVLINETYVAETFATSDILCKVRVTETFQMTSGEMEYDRFFMEYTSIASTHKAHIKLYHSTSTVYAGQAVGGGKYEFNDPNIGFSEFRESLSVQVKLRGGGYYVEVPVSGKASLKGYDISWEGDRDSQFYRFMRMYDTIGPLPTAWLIVEDDDDLQWCIFAHMLTPPGGSHTYPMDSVTSFKILEAA